MSDDLPEIGPSLEIATALGGTIASLEKANEGLTVMIEGYEAMALLFAENGLAPAAAALRGGNEALESHQEFLRAVAAILEPVVTIFHKADQGDE